MESNQLLEDLSRAMEAAKPAQEFCFFGIQHWSTCMTKSEWSGWMQAIFSALAVFLSAILAIWINYLTERRRRIESLTEAVIMAENLYTAVCRAVAIDSQKKIGDLGSLFENSLHHANSISNDYLSIDARFAINGLRTISRMAYDASKGSNTKLTDHSWWILTFMQWKNRVDEHLRALLIQLPAKHRHKFASSVTLEP